LAAYLNNSFRRGACRRIDVGAGETIDEEEVRESE
jgi:hypothetical protein